MLRAVDALDVIMHLTFSNTLGFLDAGGDVEDFMASLSKNSARSALVSCDAFPHRRLPTY